MDMPVTGTRIKYVGQPIERIEDPVLLTGSGRYADDMGVRPGTMHAAIVRSPHASARIVSIDKSKAESLTGVAAVLTGADIKDHTAPFLIVVKESLDQWCLAVDVVRFVGEAVAVVIATDRYIAEDGADLVGVNYDVHEPVIDPLDAAREGTPLVHDPAGRNVVSDRFFTYGDPDKAFAEADHVVATTINYPRNSHTPLEGYVVDAAYSPNDGVYDVLSNFQGPFTVHPVISRSLRVSGAQLRMRTAPFSGGGFGVKQAVFPYIVLCCVASKLIGRPVKWVEDRLENLTAAIAAPNRVVNVEAAVMNDGRVTALRYDQLDDYGAYLRPPMPGPLYRQHGVMTGPYDIRHMTIRNRLVMTNKTPSGMVRGFGGPQAFYALERLMHRVAETLELDRLEVIRRNLVPNDAFPYRAAAGALLDSGDYQGVIDIATADGRLDALRERRARAREEGRLYGIGMAAVSDPAHSNMGYLSTIQTPAERKRGGYKGGNVSYVTISMEVLGTINVTTDSIPQGQGHATVLAQIVADELGVMPDQVHVNTELDTQKDAWSIATGNYSCRFSSATAVAARNAAIELRGRLAEIAADTLGAEPDDIVFENNVVFSRHDPAIVLKLHRVAGKAHWEPGNLPEGMSPGMRVTGVFSPPELDPPTDKDEINTSLTYGFVFDYCGVEIDRDTGQVMVDEYVTTHDSGKILNPLIYNGQTYGAFAWAVGCALYEEFVYGPDGEFLSGTFADYLCPTVHEVPDLEVRHHHTPTPLTPLGAKGGAEGNVLATPVCLANAVCDALGIDHIDLPMKPSTISEFIHGQETPPSRPSESQDSRQQSTAQRSGDALVGSGSHVVPVSSTEVWKALLDPENLAAVIPGCKELQLVGENEYLAVVTLGAGPVKGEFRAHVSLSDLKEPSYAKLMGDLTGPLGASRGAGRIRLVEEDGGTRVSYDYEAEISGKIAAIGGRMLDGATRAVIHQFFHRFTSRVARAEIPSGLWARVLRLLGMGG